MHAMSHCVQQIRDFGCPPFCSTNETEKGHQLIKAPWRDSNNGPQAFEFVLKDESRNYGLDCWEDDFEPRQPAVGVVSINPYYGNLSISGDVACNSQDHDFL